MTIALALTAITASTLAWIAYLVVLGIYNVFFHPLARFPGPRVARLTTWWKMYVEVVRQESMVHLLVKLHKEHGDIVRVGPNELHFAHPDAYHDIYNASNRWDKENKLYESFGEDHSSFGLTKYAEAKQRKDVLQPLFSRRSILNAQNLVQEKAEHLVASLIRVNESGKSSDLLFALRCFTVDMVTAFSFSRSVDALSAPDFAAPIVQAMDNSLPTFHLFHHFPLFRKLIFSLPPHIAIKASPETAGLTRLQVILSQQIEDLVSNPAILEASPHPTIYHRLLDAKVHESNYLFTTRALLDEALTMLFAGGVTVGDTSMTGFYHILSNPALYRALRDELAALWPNPTDAPPSLEALETLPLLVATIKESLRMAPGACSPMLRIVPAAGASIAGTLVPGNAIVGSATHFVHRSPELFASPHAFDPARWLPSTPEMERNLVAFSRGPRSCLGVNLAWCELLVLYAVLVRRVVMRLDGTVEGDLQWRDCFTPFYAGRHLRAFCELTRE